MSKYADSILDKTSSVLSGLKSTNFSQFFIASLKLLISAYKLPNFKYGKLNSGDVLIAFFNSDIASSVWLFFNLSFDWKTKNFY